MFAIRNMGTPTMRDEIEFWAKPVGITDVLGGVRYATAFDAKGWSVSHDRHSRRCRRMMARIVSSAGNRPRTDGAITLDPVRRALEDRYRRVAGVVEAHCATCPCRRRSECAGWALEPST